MNTHRHGGGKQKLKLEREREMVPAVFCIGANGRKVLVDTCSAPSRGLRERRRKASRQKLQGIPAQLTKARRTVKIAKEMSSELYRFTVVADLYDRDPRVRECRKRSFVTVVGLEITMGSSPCTHLM